MAQDALSIPCPQNHIGRATHFVVSGWQEMSKGGQKLQSGRLTHLVDQQICWYGWCWLAVPFVVSVPFDDKICWYGHAFRINILYNWPILLMDKQQMVDHQNQHSVQFSQMLAGVGGGLRLTIHFQFLAIHPHILWNVSNDWSSESTFCAFAQILGGGHPDPECAASRSSF